MLATVLCGALRSGGAAHADRGRAAQRERLLTFATREIERFRGQLMRRPEAGASEFMATFDGPARAIRCGAMIAEAARRLRRRRSASARTPGECEVFGDTIRASPSRRALTVAAQAGARRAGRVAHRPRSRRRFGTEVQGLRASRPPNGDSELTLFCVEAAHLSSALLSY